MSTKSSAIIAAQEKDGLQSISFTVDAALLRELGERLVGKPHIALAELVKNSYDADATKVIIRFGPERIEVIDNGHGMDFTEFKDFWMRIGSPHKQAQRVSREFQRPMTGSKGIGRLAVQFLGRRLEMHTVPKKATDSELEAHVNWDEAARAVDLIRAEARYRQIPRTTEFPENGKHGTAITLSSLNHDWAVDDIVRLAREIWWLQPPFRPNPRLRSDRQKAFEVKLESPDEKAIEKFNAQMQAILDIWTARLLGRIVEPSENGDGAMCLVNLLLEFSDGVRMTQEYAIPDCNLYGLEFEIRMFSLHYRQPRGITVSEAREYFNNHGGVHVYDAGFHMPYYGPKNDWLGIEFDHSHRLSRSQLLPDELQIPEGMTYLPTSSRMFGVVHVDTAREREAAELRGAEKEGEYLKIQVSRDRLVDNKAYQNLHDVLRWALDFYAMQEAQRRFEEALASRSVEPVQEKFERVDEVLVRYQEVIPEPAYRKLRVQVQEAIDASETEAELMARRAGLLGSLATAGMSALAYEHEVHKQYLLLEDVVKQLGEIRVSDEATRDRLNEIADDLDEWIQWAKATRRLFSPLLNEEDRDLVARFKTRELVRDVAERMGILIRGIKPDVNGIDEALRLPHGRFVEWSAIFQNVFTNAVNAMLDSVEKRIVVSSRTSGRRRFLLVQDTGCGVALEEAGELFKPFKRRITISPERRALGLGGSGLGLTIVRMLASNLGCRVSFVEPEEGFSTAFQISWREQE